MTSFRIDPSFLHVLSRQDRETLCSNLTRIMPAQAHFLQQLEAALLEAAHISSPMMLPPLSRPSSQNLGVALAFPRLMERLRSAIATMTQTELFSVIDGEEIMKAREK